MQVALITGGSAGIGQAAARELGRRGVAVVITYRSRVEEASRTVAAIEADGGRAAALHLEVGDVASFPGFVERLRETLRERWAATGLRYLVNNAGIGGGAPFGEVTEEQFDTFHHILFKGPYFLTQHLLPLLEDGGAIVNTGSTSALERGTSPGYSSYAAQKGAMHVVTRYWAKELSPRGIRVNAVAPGTTRTRIGDDVFDRIADQIPAMAAAVALGRIGEPEDVGRVIAFLLDDAGSWITGQVVEASGGERL